MGAWIFPACGARMAGTCMHSLEPIAKDPGGKRSTQRHATVAPSQASCFMSVSEPAAREKALPCCCDVPTWDTFSSS